MILWREAAFLTEVWPDHTQIRRATTVLWMPFIKCTNAALLIFLYTQNQLTSDATRDFCHDMAKGKITYTISGWIIMFCNQTLDQFQVLLEYAEVWHLLALRMLLTYVFHLYSLSSRSHNVLWATVTKTRHAWHKISFCGGTVYLEMLLFIQTSWRFHLFFA